MPAAFFTTCAVNLSLSSLPSLVPSSNLVPTAVPMSRSISKAGIGILRQPSSERQCDWIPLSGRVKRTIRMRKSQLSLFSANSRFNNLISAVCDSHDTSSRASITSTIDAFALAGSFDFRVVTTCRIKFSISGIVDGDTRTFLAWTIDSGIGLAEQRYARVVFVRNSILCV